LPINYYTTLPSVTATETGLRMKSRIKKETVQGRSLSHSDSVNCFL
jgi:hypothetical protein